MVLFLYAQKKKDKKKVEWIIGNHQLKELLELSVKRFLSKDALLGYVGTWIHYATVVNNNSFRLKGGEWVGF